MTEASDHWDAAERRSQLVGRRVSDREAAAAIERSNEAIRAVAAAMEHLSDALRTAVLHQGRWIRAWLTVLSVAVVVLIAVVALT